MDKNKSDNVIPPMTDPLSRHWKQPKTEDILIDDINAVMTQADFKKLPEYSTTKPSGVYPGKMWKSDHTDEDGRHVHWALKWFGIVPGNDKVCSNNWRIILLVD